MTESTPPSVPRRVSWRRARVYAWAIALVLAFYFFGAVSLIRQQPRRVVHHLLAYFPFPSRVGAVTWLDAQRLEMRDVKIGDFFYAYAITVTASPYQLFRHHITEIDVTGPQLFTSKLNNALASGRRGDAQGLDWTITRLVIRSGTVMLDGIGPDMPSIPIRLGVRQPIILNYVKLRKPDDSVTMTRPRTIDIENVLIVSPVDALAPVLSFPLIRLTFTYAEIWKHHIREVDFIRPVMFLGQDLFWFSDEFKKQRATITPTGVHAPWQMGRFQVSYGQLAVNVFGQPKVQFPFFFDTEVNNIRFDQLDKISAKSVIAIRRLNQEYPDYKIKIVNLTGKLEFSIPPTNPTANNVVPSVHIDELSWNGIAATDVASSVVFDPTGVYGKLAGKCEGGDVQGHFEVDYTKGFTWNADLVSHRIDCASITQKLAGKYASLTGTTDGTIGVQGKATEILGCHGSLRMLHPGLLQIHSVDDLLQRLPGAAGSMQNQALKLVLASLKNYPYRTGDLEINYQPSGGVGTLNLDSPNGKRRFSVYLHPYESSKIANADDSH
jgi:hypothetical protein